MTKEKEKQHQENGSSSEKEIHGSLEDAELLNLHKQIAKLAMVLEKMRLADYIAYLNRPGRLLLVNFVLGLVRGLGAALGASILAGLALIFLKNLVVLNLPIIGGLIAELVRIVNTYQGQ